MFGNHQVIFIAAMAENPVFTRSKTPAVILRWSAKEEGVAFGALEQDLGSGQCGTLQGGHMRSLSIRLPPGLAGSQRDFCRGIWEVSSPP